MGGGTPARRRVWRRPYAVRRPGEYRLEGPGDLVEMDILGLRMLSLIQEAVELVREKREPRH